MTWYAYGGRPDDYARVRGTLDLAPYATLRVIAGKWKPLILYFLAQGGPTRYGELRRAVLDELRATLALPPPVPPP